MAKTTKYAPQTIDWSCVAEKVFGVLMITREYPASIVKLARQHSVPYESIVAASITGLISEYVEAELESQSKTRKRELRPKNKPKSSWLPSKK